MIHSYLAISSIAFSFWFAFFWQDDTTHKNDLDSWFALLFSSNSLDEAEKFAEELRFRIENLKIRHEGSKVSDYITVSIGLFFSEDLENMNLESIYRACDEALYEAKSSGRNKVVVASS